MAKVAILVPYQEMCEMARPLADQYENVNVMCIEYIQTEQVAERAHQLEEDGCELIVARGVHAGIIKRSIRVPLVEIRVTAQELGIVMLDVKKQLGLECPRIGLIGLEDMFCDTKPFNTLFGIELRCYMVEHSEELSGAVERAKAEGCQAVVGGEIVCACAKAVGIVNRFVSSGMESLQTALTTASRVCYAIDLEKSSSAEMNTMLDFTFNGIMQVDPDGIVCRANRVAFNLLNQRPGDMVGRSISEVLPQLAEAVLDKALTEGQETYAILLPIQQKEMLVNIAPILNDSSVKGAILTFQEGSRIVEMDMELRRELYQRGHLAKYTFDRIPYVSKISLEIVNLAKQIARYDAPVLITGETGCGKGVLAQCIHNESLACGNAFVHLDCSAYQSDTLDTLLFGNYSTRKDAPACMVDAARGGTLYLSYVEALSPELQYKLLELLRGRFLHNGSHLPSAVSLRIIASSRANLAALVDQGEFREDLYYALSILTLELPPLRRRREDILPWVDFYLKDWESRYKRYVSLTQGAKDFLENCDWPGNLDQVNNLSQRIVLLSKKRTVDEGFLRLQMEQLSPRVLHGTDQVVVFQNAEAVKITELLQKYGGNRQKVADELGISKSTLWRHIKKYGIDPKHFS